LLNFVFKYRKSLIAVEANLGDPEFTTQFYFSLLDVFGVGKSGPVVVESSLPSALLAEHAATLAAVALPDKHGELLQAMPALTHLLGRHPLLFRQLPVKKTRHVAQTRAV
jgi:hypothetical protein